VKRRNHMQDLVVKGRIILKWNLKKYDCENVDWVDLAQNRVHWLAHHDGYLGFMKGGEFLDQPCYCQLLREDSVPCT
jgi:hypothetical protein